MDLPTASMEQRAGLSFTALKGIPLRVVAASAPGDLLGLDVDAVPERSTWLLWLAGGLLLRGAARFRSRPRHGPSALGR